MLNTKEHILNNVSIGNQNVQQKKVIYTDLEQYKGE